MTRLREKGGADPNTLYELTNGFVNASRVPQQRPGTTWEYTWPAHTKGLCSYKDALVAFSSQVIDTGRTDFIVATLRHPSGDFTGDIQEIHYAQPFMGNLYVVAEFDDGTVRHYWLQDPDTWQADTIYVENDLVQPSTPNGYYYKLVRTENPPAWAPGVERALGDVVQPTVYTGWKYTVVDVSDGSGGGGGGGGGDPAGRVSNLSITYADGVAPNVDVTDFKNMVGRSSRSDTPVDWPYVSGDTISWQHPSGKYIAAALVVPSGADATPHNIKRTSYGGGTAMKVSISTSPGDFDPASALRVVHDVMPNDQPAIWWRVGATTDFYVGLTAGQTYYLNIALEDASTGSPIEILYT